MGGEAWHSVMAGGGCWAGPAGQAGVRAACSRQARSGDWAAEAG